MKIDDDAVYSQKLKHALGIALDSWIEIMTFEPKRVTTRHLNLKERCADHIVRASIAVGGQELKRKTADGLAHLLKEMREHEKRLKLSKPASKVIKQAAEIVEDKETTS